MSTRVYYSDEVSGELGEVEIPDPQFKTVIDMLALGYEQVAGHILLALHVVNVMDGKGFGEQITDVTTTEPDHETLIVRGIWDDRPKTFIIAAGPSAKQVVEAWLAREFGEGEDDGHEVTD